MFIDLISFQGDKESACLVYEKAIAAEKEKEQSQLLPMLLIQYSRFLYMVSVCRNFEIMFALIFNHNYICLSNFCHLNIRQF